MSSTTVTGKKPSPAQIPVLRAAIDGKLHVSTKWSTWDFWIHGIMNVAKASVRRATIDSMVSKGLLAKPASGDTVVQPTEWGRAALGEQVQDPDRFEVRLDDPDTGERISCKSWLSAQQTAARWAGNGRPAAPYLGRRTAAGWVWYRHGQTSKPAPRRPDDLPVHRPAGEQPAAGYLICTECGARVSDEDGTVEAGNTTICEHTQQEAELRAPRDDE
jgi:hypothetical protein